MPNNTRKEGEEPLKMPTTPLWSDEEIERMAQVSVRLETRERNPEDVNPHDPGTHEHRTMIGNYPADKWHELHSEEFSNAEHRERFKAALRYARDHAPHSPEVGELVRAADGVAQIIRDAQSIMIEYLVPDGISEKAALEKLIYLFDCPEERAKMQAYDSAKSSLPPVVEGRERSSSGDGGDTPTGSGPSTGSVPETGTAFGAVPVPIANKPDGR